MDYYALIRPLLFAFPAETAHTLSLRLLASGLAPAQRVQASSRLSQALFGLTFVHPLGLAAGYDKNAEALDALTRLGFAFVEAGSVTPRPQEGNPKPRLFRLAEDRAVINRMGFNNKGAEIFVRNLAKRASSAGIVGANIGKNKDTIDAAADYVALLPKVAPHADYVTINISSPNTKGLRDLQEREQLDALLTAIVQSRAGIAALLNRRIPLLLKIAPDLSQAQAEAIAEIALLRGIDGLIVSNTTTARPDTLQSEHKHEQGGLSGAPLFEPSTRMLRVMYRLTGGQLPLVGVGGIGSAEQAYAKIRAGASLLQVYSALVYRGPGLIGEIVSGLDTCLARDGFSHLSEAVGMDAR